MLTHCLSNNNKKPAIKEITFYCIDREGAHELGTSAYKCLGIGTIRLTTENCYKEEKKRENKNISTDETSPKNQPCNRREL